MPDPRRILTTVHRATELFLHTPRRSGLLVDLVAARPEADVFVVGDLHGNLANFRAALTAAALDRHPFRHIVFQEVVHGPFRYPGNGCTSHQIVDLIAALKCRFGERVHYIPGNHEIAELRRATILKNGERQDVAFRAGIEHAYGRWAVEIHHAYRRLFASLPLAVRTPNGVLIVHSLPDERTLERGFDFGVFAAATLDELSLERRSPAYELLWGRRTSRKSAEAFLGNLGCRFAVTGHLPSPEGFQIIDDYRIVVDASRCPGCACLVPLSEQIRSAAELQARLVRLS